MRTTIAICCFNAQDTIARAIASAQAVQWDDLEIVVCDDASTDGSAAVVSRIAEADPRVRLIRHAVNGGVARTRNSLARSATGEVLAFLDDDDECLPDRLVRQVGLLLKTERETGTMVVCYGARMTSNANGATKTVLSLGHAGGISGKPVALYLLSGTPISGPGKTGTCTFVARTEAVRSLPFDEQLLRSEDREWAIRFALAGGTIVSCREPVIEKHETVGADKSPAKHQAARFQIVLKHRDFLRREGAYFSALALHLHPKVRFWGITSLGRAVNRWTRPRAAS